MFKRLIICICIFGLVNSAPTTTGCLLPQKTAIISVVHKAIEAVHDKETMNLITEAFRHVSKHIGEVLNCVGSKLDDAVNHGFNVYHLLESRIRQVLDIGPEDDIIAAISKFETPETLQELTKDPQVKREFEKLLTALGEERKVAMKCYLNVLSPFFPRAFIAAEKLKLNPQELLCLHQ